MRIIGSKHALSACGLKAAGELNSGELFSRRLTQEEQEFFAAQIAQANAGEHTCIATLLWAPARLGNVYPRDHFDQSDHLIPLSLVD